ncbi:hypothetical protein ABH920_008318 [Catenulispora sp. EB89]
MCGCGLLVGFKSFLRLRLRFGDLAGGRSSVVCLGTRWRPAVVRVHDRARVRVAAHTSGGRAAAACGGHLKVKGRASGGACAASGLAPGRGGSRCWAPVVACGRLVPGSPSRRRLTEADRSGGIKSDPCCCGGVSCDLTPPARSAWLRPPTRRGTRDNPGLWCGHGPLGFVHLRVVTWRVQGVGIFPTGGVVPDPSSLSAVLAQPSRPGGVKPDETGPQQRVMRLYPARPGWFPLGRRQRRGIRDKATNTRTAAEAGGWGSLRVSSAPAGGACL